MFQITDRLQLQAPEFLPEVLQGKTPVGLDLSERRGVPQWK
jgi:hypothetical protein